MARAELATLASRPSLDSGHGPALYYAVNYLDP